MNRKTIAAIVPTAMLIFSLGWMLGHFQCFSTVPPNKNQGLDSIQKVHQSHSQMMQKRLDSLTVLSNTYDKTQNFRQQLSGEFVLKDAQYAGFNFIDSKTVAWTNEMDISHPDTMKIRWVNNATFFARTIHRHDEICPPRVWVCQVVSFDGKRLVLNDIWAGWNDSADSRLEFRKVQVSQN
jgi:hypothetical protein